MGNFIKLAKVYAATAAGHGNRCQRPPLRGDHRGHAAKTDRCSTASNSPRYAPSLPKTTPATYVPNAELMMEQFPPHEYPELWTLVPAKTSKGRIGYVACEVL